MAFILHIVKLVSTVEVDITERFTQIMFYTVFLGLPSQDSSLDSGWHKVRVLGL